MFRSILAAGVFAAAFAQPVFAEDAMKAAAPMACDDASMMKVQHEVDAMTGDAMKKEEAAKHVAMAKDAMKMNKADDCAMHLGEAAHSAMKKM